MHHLRRPETGPPEVKNVRGGRKYKENDRKKEEEELRKDVRHETLIKVSRPRIDTGEPGDSVRPQKDETRDDTDIMILSQVVWCPRANHLLTYLVS